MPIHPITVKRLKTFVLLGHSNADGWAPMDYVYDGSGTTGHLQPQTTAPKTNPLDAWWKNVYVATWAQPWPGANGTPVYASPDNVDMLEMTVACPLTPAGDHPHPSPYNYPNVAGASYPRWGYLSFPYANFTYDSGSPSGPWLDNIDDSYGARTGIEVPLSWHWKNYWQEQVGVVKVAFSSSFLLPAESGSGTGFVDPALFPLGVEPSDWSPSTSRPVETAIDGSFGYTSNWTPSDAFDFAPSTDRFYRYWFQKMQGAAAALPSDSKLDVRLVIGWMGDNDSVARSSQVLEQDWKKTVQKFVQRIRQDLVENDWTALPKEQIVVVWPKVHTGYPNTVSPGYDSITFMNGVLDEIAKEDEFFRTIDSKDWKTLDDENLDIYSAVLNATNHFGPEGYRQAAEDVMDAFGGVAIDAFDALDQEETKTVSEAKDAIRVYYAKNRSNTDMSDEIVLQHLNGAMFHVFNHIGDNAWWLRRRQVLSLDGGPTRITTLPRYVKRLLFIEDSSDPNYPVRFDQVGHGSGGRLQINMVERSSGTFTCQFITNPRELTKDDQIVPAPRQVFEWIVVETCRRMAASSSNAPLSAFFAGEARQLMEDCMRNAGQTQRSKNDVMRTQRRRPRLGYSKGPGRFFWGRGQ